MPSRRSAADRGRMYSCTSQVSQFYTRIQAWMTPASQAPSDDIACYDAGHNISDYIAIIITE